MAQYFLLRSTANGDLHYCDEDGNLYIAGTLFADSIDAGAIAYDGATLPATTTALANSVLQVNSDPEATLGWTGSPLLTSISLKDGPYSLSIFADLPAVSRQLYLAPNSTTTLITDGTCNLSGTNTGDQLTFRTITVAGQGAVVADAASDTLTLVAGSNIAIATDTASDSITLSATGGGGTTTLTGAVTGTGTGTVATTLADDAVITSKLAFGAVITAKIADDAISTAKIADEAITSAKIEDLAVSTAKIADDAITYGKLQHVSSQRILGRISASTGQVEELTPENIINLTKSPGEIITMASGSTPLGAWLECSGQAVSRTTYSVLFSAISTTYGVGNGSTTFNVPDLRGRCGIGAGTGSGLTARTLGAALGAENHTLSQAETPNHNVPIRFSSAGGGGGGLAVLDGGGANTYNVGTNTGGNGSHNNMQPSIVLKYWIKT